MTFVKKPRRNDESQLPDGYVQVEFDAGGQASYVSPNPVRPILEGDQMVVRWRMEKAPLHANADFEVSLGNVVPCVQEELIGLQSERDPDGKGWTWRLTWTGLAPSLPEGESFIFYDVFFIYQPKGNPPGPGPQKPRHRQTVSLRQILSTDPTLILPPKEGGGMRRLPPRRK